MDGVDADTPFFALVAPVEGYTLHRCVCHECGHSWPYAGGDDRCSWCRGKDTQVVDGETGVPVEGKD